MQDLVAEYTVTLQEGVTEQEFRTEVAETIEMFRGIRRFNVLQMADNKLAIELHLHGQTDRKVAEKMGERVHKTLVRFDMAAIEYHGIEFPDEIEIAKDKWQGRDAVEAIVREIGGVPFIRLDYYMRGLSMEDLGITDANLETIWVKSLQGWPNKLIGRSCIRRLRDHFQRIEEITAIYGPQEKPRGRTTRVTSSLSGHAKPELPPGETGETGETGEGDVATPAAATA